MVEDQSSRKVKKFIFSVSLFLLLTNLSFAKNFNLEKIVDLNGPWGSSFINNEELIITEKSGKIKVVNIISKQISEIKHNLNFLEHGQGGILDILFKDNFIYVSYTENRGNGKTSTSIAKTKFSKNHHVSMPHFHSCKLPNSLAYWSDISLFSFSFFFNTRVR